MKLCPPPARASLRAAFNGRPRSPRRVAHPGDPGDGRLDWAVPTEPGDSKTSKSHCQPRHRESVDAYYSCRAWLTSKSPTPSCRTSDRLRQPWGGSSAYLKRSPIGPYRSRVHQFTITRSVAVRMIASRRLQADRHVRTSPEMGVRSTSVRIGRAVVALAVNCPAMKFDSLFRFFRRPADYHGQRRPEPTCGRAKCAFPAGLTFSSLMVVAPRC